jgi:hypothetical protein
MEKHLDHIRRIMSITIEEGEIAGGGMAITGAGPKPAPVIKKRGYFFSFKARQIRSEVTGSSLMRTPVAS